MGIGSGNLASLATSSVRKSLFFTAALLGLLVIFGASGDTAFARGTTSSFSGTGFIGVIDLGDVTPAGDSGRFVVKDRTVTGFVDAFGPVGPLVGPFSATFGTNVPITTQAGNIHGTLSLSTFFNGELDAKFIAKSSPIAIGLETFELIPGSGIFGRYAGLAIDGKMTFTSGTQGRGDISGEFWVIVDASTGHVLSGAPPGQTFTNILGGPNVTGPSTIGMSGTWRR
jgi:hypothetical protein